VVVFVGRAEDVTSFLAKTAAINMRTCRYHALLFELRIYSFGVDSFR
jgi:hypothetical protein